MPRANQRRADAPRKITMTRGFTRNAPGSVLIKCGDTHVLCTACFEEGVPLWKKGEGSGWCTAEYDMLPWATSSRRRRNRSKIDGRTQEIQRLIGRSLRAVIDLECIGENSLLIDCDVLQADGGTRTASITGAYVAAYDAIRDAIKQKIITHVPFVDSVAAISVGKVDGRILLDLDYAEDSKADVDMNVVMTGSGKFIEVQGTGEGATFSSDDLQRMLTLARRGISILTKEQDKALKTRRGRKA